MANSLPLVSIVTPSFNQGNFIERTILSVLRQNYPRLEYILIDGLSTDETMATVRKYSKHISVIISEKDNGQTEALNKGFSVASGQIMSYLNADDCFSGPFVVADAVDELMTGCSDVVYGRRYRITRDGQFFDCYPFREFDADAIRKFNIIPQECSFWKREIFERSGAHFREELRFSMDYELWLRFLKHGARFKAIDKVFAFFRWHENQKSQTIWREVCLPEVEKIQLEYNGTSTTTGSMEQLHESFFFGAPLESAPRSRAVAMKLWRAQVEHAQRMLNSTPLDHWVYKQYEENYVRE